MDDADRECLLATLGQALARFGAVVLAYCLMGNHYHLVLQTGRPNLSRLMRHVNGVYAQAFNRRHRLVGHLFQGRFGAILVDRDAYLLEVCRYTELNPVRAGLTAAPQEWRWSSFRAHCGLAVAPWWLDTATMHGHLLGRDAASRADRLHAADAYARFVSAGRDVRLWAQSLRQGIYLGDDDFIGRARARVSPARVISREIPREQRRAPGARRMPAGERSRRDELIHEAYLSGGLSMSAIAAEVGLSASRVSRVIASREAKGKT